MSKKSKSDWEKRNIDLRTAQDADQTERSAILLGRCNLDAGLRDSLISGETENYISPFAVDNWAESDMQLDDAYTPLADEFSRRQSILDDLYPFEINGNQLIYHGSNTLAYELCLAISCAPSLTKGAFNQLPPSFERLALTASVCYLGKESWYHRTGWPWDEVDGTRIHSFEQIANHLFEHTGEWEWHPRPGYPSTPTHQDQKDLGIDFVISKPFCDRRVGQLFLVGQCACGNDWDSKFNNIDTKRLDTWFRPTTHVPFTRVFAIPHHIANETYFSDVCCQAGITLDRTRLVKTIEHPDNREFFRQIFTDPIVDLIRLVFPNFQADPQAN